MKFGDCKWAKFNDFGFLVQQLRLGNIEKEICKLKVSDFKTIGLIWLN